MRWSVSGIWGPWLRGGSFVLFCAGRGTAVRQDRRRGAPEEGLSETPRRAGPRRSAVVPRAIPAHGRTPLRDGRVRRGGRSSPVRLRPVEGPLSETAASDRDPGSAPGPRSSGFRPHALARARSRNQPEGGRPETPGARTSSCPVFTPAGGHAGGLGPSGMGARGRRAHAARPASGRLRLSGHEKETVTLAPSLGWDDGLGRT